MPRRVGTGVDPKRLSMIVAVLGRHAGVPLGQADVFVNVAGGVRIDEPGADLGVALAIASAARGLPVRPGVACFGEVGLTGRLRPASARPSGASASAPSSASRRRSVSGRHRVPWQNAPDSGGERCGQAIDCGARCERTRGRIRRSSRRSSRWRRDRLCARGSTTSSAPSTARSSSSASRTSSRSSSRAACGSTCRSRPSSSTSWPRWTARSSINADDREARLRERPAHARSRDPLERDRHAAPHSRARREADRRARRSRSRSSARR